MKKKFICTVCGYVHEGEEAPEKCPLCKVGKEKFKELEDLVVISPEWKIPYPLWSLPADSLRLHPYIGNLETARAIVLYRNNSPKDRCTIEELRIAGILTTENANKLSKCLISKP